MASSVTNTVNTVFTVTDRASAQILRIANAANSAAGAVSRMQSALRGAASVSMAHMALNLGATTHAVSQLNRELARTAALNRSIGPIRTRVVGGAGGGAVGTAVRTTAVATSGLGSALGFSSAAISSVAGAIYAVKSVGSAAVTATQQVLDLHRTYEDMRLAFAGEVEALGMAKSFQEADAQAGLLMKRIRIMAAQLPGDMNYYAQIVQESTTALFRGGLSNMEDILKFVGKYGTVVYPVAARHKDLGMASRELFAMIGGQARRQMPLFNMLSQHMDTAYQAVERFNRLDPAGRLAQITKAVERFGGVSEHAFELTSAKLGELSDNIREIIRLGTLPFMAGFKTLVDKFNHLLTSNQAPLAGLLHALVSVVTGVATYLMPVIQMVQRLFETMGSWGPAFVSSLDRIIGAFEAFAPLFDTKKWSLIADVFMGVLNVFASSVENIVRSLVAAKYYLTTPMGVADAFAAAESFMETQRRLREQARADITATAFNPPNVPTDRTTNNFDFRGSRFDIRQNFAEGFDPDRIAVAFASDLARLGEYRAQSSFDPLFSTR